MHAASVSRERRVTLATKWAFLDDLNADEIVDRFEEEFGIELTKRTVRNYLNEKEAEEVAEQIEEKHAETRLQIAEREEQMYRRARRDEQQAVRDEPIKAVVPTADVVTEDMGQVSRQAWEFIDPDDDDWPAWATPGLDAPIRFVDEEVVLQPGDRYPLQRLDGGPVYQTQFVGMERDVPDLKGRRSARREQSSHLEAKGRVLGVYEETINLDVDGEVEHTGDDDVAEEVQELREELAATLRGTTPDDAGEDGEGQDDVDDIGGGGS